MEVDFRTFVTQFARNRGTRYGCVCGGGNCGAIFQTEDDMIQHLSRAELDGGHGTEMLNIYNNINGFLARARQPATSYDEETSIGRAISEEEVASKICAGNSEGEGDDPLCISYAKKGKARAMGLTWPTGPPFKRSRYPKNVVGESTVKISELPESLRADAVSSMVYEANARIRDPVYGCAGAVYHLQKQVSELQAQLAKAQAELVTMQCQQANLVALICMEMTQSQEPSMQLETYENPSLFLLDDGNLGSTNWEPLWT